MLGRLMTARRFAPLFWCQFFSAFNDNFVKTALALLILFKLGSERGPALVTLAGGLFMLPFLLVSGLGGEIADRSDKAVVARRLKLAEIAVVAVAAAGFVLEDATVLLAALTGMGTLGALFGPIKYGILPDHLGKDELVAGNALVETATFLAILAGMVGGGAAIAALDHRYVAAAAVVFAVASWGFALLIPPTGSRAPELRPTWNIAAGTWRILAGLARRGPLWRAALTISWFWAVGTVVLSLLPTLVKEALGGSESVVTLCLALFVVGIALGSGLAAWLSRGRILLVLAPIGAALIGAFGLDLGVHLAGRTPPPEPLDWLRFWGEAGATRIVADLVGLAAAGGLLVVPVFAWLQAAAGEAERARVVAANNVVNAAFMVAASAVVVALQLAGLSAAVIAAGTGAASLVVAVAMAVGLGRIVKRDLVLLIYRLAFRLEVTGTENLTATPNAVICVNHVSFLDAPLIMALLDNDPVFAIDRTIATRWWVKPFLKLARTFPLDPTKPLATRALIAEVRAGDSLVIFPEGRITVTGAVMKIYDGAALIADRSNAPVVPVRIEGLEQTPFSHLDRHQTRKRLFPKVKVTILPPRGLAVAPELVGRKRRLAAGRALTDVMSGLIYETTPTGLTVPEAIVATARRLGGRTLCVEDPLGTRLGYGRLLTASAVLGRKIAAATAPGETVGVFLPNAAGVAVTVVAVLREGRVAAMLNYTAGPQNLASACRTAKIKTVYSSKAFIAKARLERELAAIAEVAEVVMLEDLRATIGRIDKLRGLATARRIAARDPDAPAVVLFTSGSEGAPKGVVLSHRNLLANCAQVVARIDLVGSDLIFNVLPVFHAFGLTGGLVLPLVAGFRTYLYPSPLHYRIIPELVYATNATAIVGTDTFLSGYARSAHPYDFRSLRFVVGGAEPVRGETRRLWAERFGQRILEGYGVTETSPVIAVNTPFFNRAGTVGRLLPGIEHRLEAVDGVAEGGRLLVRGPNVMLGYLKAETPGEIAPPAEGWHDTGDVVTIDADGYVAIKGRLKRFAKVAGEMVSLVVAEDIATAAFPDDRHAALAEPDPRRGERIVLYTTAGSLTRARLQEAARGLGAPELAIASEVVAVAELPLLGSGKVDYPALAAARRAILAERAGG